MEKYIYFFVILFLVVLVPAVLYLIFKPTFQQCKLLNGVVNYDIFMRKFVFEIAFTKEEFFSRFEIYNVNDVLEYDFDEQNSVVTFKRYNAEFPYKIEIDEFKESIVLRVEQIPLVMAKGNVPYYINEFFVKKFNAKPLEFEKYSF